MMASLFDKGIGLCLIPALGDVLLLGKYFLTSVFGTASVV